MNGKTARIARWAGFELGLALVLAFGLAVAVPHGALAQGEQPLTRQDLDRAIDRVVVQITALMEADRQARLELREADRREQTAYQRAQAAQREADRREYAIQMEALRVGLEAQMEVLRIGLEAKIDTETSALEQRIIEREAAQVLWFVGATIPVMLGVLAAIPLYIKFVRWVLGANFSLPSWRGNGKPAGTARARVNGGRAAQSEEGRSRNSGRRRAAGANSGNSGGRGAVKAKAKAAKVAEGGSKQRGAGGGRRQRGGAVGVAA